MSIPDRRCHNDVTDPGTRLAGTCCGVIEDGLDDT